MRIDCHTHLFPESVQKNRNAFFDDPAFRLLYENPRARLEGPQALLLSMEKHQVDLSLAAGFPWRNRDRLKAHNDFLLETQARHPDRILALCCVHPEDPWAEGEARRCLEAGAFGLGEIACYDRDFDTKILENLDPVMALCENFRAPVLIHVNDPVGHGYPGKAPITLQALESLILRFPQNPMILAHGGGGYPLYSLMKKGLAGHPDFLFFDTAAFPYLYKKDIYPVLIRLLGEGRLLFGSDWPLLEPDRYFQDMAQAGLSSDTIAALCGENAARFLFRKKNFA
jgi:predicted TIM-barrel fold metal-dependent hydrolase